jgi:hypothetical protein
MIRMADLNDELWWQCPKNLKSEAFAALRVHVLGLQSPLEIRCYEATGEFLESSPLKPIQWDLACQKCRPTLKLQQLRVIYF